MAAKRRLPPLDPAARESVRRFESLSAIRPMALRRYGLDIVVASITSRFASHWPNASRARLNRETIFRVQVKISRAEAIMSVDWNSVFMPTIGIAEIVLRGTIMYLGLFAVLRFVGRRQAGNFGPADLLVIVLIADAAQNGLGKEYGSVTEGLTLVLTIVGWEYLIDWLQYRYPALRPILTAPSLTLIEDGRVDRSNLRHELLTEDELCSQLREKNVLSYSEVKIAKLEGDGRLSVIKRHP